MTEQLEQAKELRECAAELTKSASELIRRAECLEAGEPLCDHHWSGDPGYECYCTGCGVHIHETSTMSGVPMAKDAYCSTCLSKKKGVV